MEGIYFGKLKLGLFRFGRNILTSPKEEVLLVSRVIHKITKTSVFMRKSHSFTKEQYESILKGIIDVGGRIISDINAFDWDLKL